MARKKPLPYAVVTQAVKGDPEAMDKVLTHYRGFIRWLAKRDYMDWENVSKSYVDESVYEELESHLMEKILFAFDLDKQA